MDIPDDMRFIYQMVELFNHRISRQVYEIFDLYTELHGARVSLFGPGGELLYPDAQSRPNCTYCSLLREMMGLDARCRKSDQQMMQESLRKRSMVTYTCHAGMLEAVAPLFVDEQLAGFVMIGQFRSETAPTSSPYADRWKKERGNQQLQAAFSQSTVFPEREIDKLLAMFQQLLELIIRGQLIRHKDYDLIQPAIERMREHPEVQLSLTEAARISGRSASAVSRLFKKLTGRSFKQYQIQFCLQQAAHQLVSEPARPVAEIARSVGFEDQFYFSRLFHRHMGQSPSEYRNHNTGALGEDISGLRPKMSAVSDQKLEVRKPATVQESVVKAPTSDIRPLTSGMSTGVSSRARNLAATKGIDASTLAGSGPDGRVIECDVKAALAGQAPFSPAAKAKIAAIGGGIGGRILAADVQVPSAAIAPAPPPPEVSYSVEQMGALKEIAVKGVRKLVAARMLSSMQTTAQLTMHTSADARVVLAARKKFKDSTDKGGITINDLVLYAVAQTLVNFPELNAYWLGEKLVQFENVHLGFAVDTPRGLMVLVIRFANKLSLDELSVETKRLGAACIKGSIDPDALKGGTFTVTNLGAAGIEMFTPVLNAPEVGILGICSVQPKPVMKKDGGVEFIPHMGLSITSNPCATDGAPAGQFLAAMRETLANLKF